MNKENQSADNERIYPCVKCGKMRTKAEGGTTFSLCEECWDEAYPTKPADNLLLTDEEVKEELKKYFTDEQTQFQEPEFTIISGIIAVIRKAQLAKVQPILDAKDKEIAELKEILETRCKMIENFISNKNHSVHIPARQDERKRIGEWLEHHVTYVEDIANLKAGETP